MKAIRSPSAINSSFFFCIILLFLNCVFNATTGIECFSCKASSSNEIEANAQCLETANVEDCNDFYLYYNQVDSRHPSSSSSTHDDEDDDFEYSNYDAHHHQTHHSSSSAAAIDEKTKKETEAEAEAEVVGSTRRRNRRANEELSGGRGRGGGGEEEIARNASDETEKLKLPTDPEHHCYSSTKKMAWENYVVEKGCKKIVHCRAHEANLPDWSMPWNFCCDKSRCNAKLVRDKPQRIFGMGCRRTDDCIQGHNTRHVCPDMFQSCPKVSTNVIKMECRTRNQQRLQNSGSRSSIASYHTYFHQSKEKKCLCSRGYYPKGPICTSKGFVFGQSIAAVLCPVLLIFEALT